MNAPRPAPDPPASGARAGKQPAPPAHSHYLQSKVVRAKERIEAEMRVAPEAESTPPPPGATPPPGSAQGGAGGSS